MHWRADTLVDDDWWLVVGFGCWNVDSLRFWVGWGWGCCLLFTFEVLEDVLGSSVRSLRGLDLFGLSVGVLGFLGCLVTFLELGQFGQFGESVRSFGSFGNFLDDCWGISGCDVCFWLLVDVDWWMTGIDDVWGFGSFRNDRGNVLDLGFLGCFVSLDFGCFVALDFGCLGFLGCLVALGFGNLWFLGCAIAFSDLGEFEFWQLG